MAKVRVIRGAVNPEAGDLTNGARVILSPCGGRFEGEMPGLGGWNGKGPDRGCRGARTPRRAEEERAQHKWTHF